MTSGALAFGCWRFVGMSTAEATERIEAALAAGMNLIDTADVYGFDWGGTGFGQAEELLGAVLRARPDLRNRMVLATKGGIYPPLPYDSSPNYLRSAVDASLRRLGVDVIDLYQIHRPDMFAHPEDVAVTLVALRDEGKIREVGVSNYTVAQYDALASYLPFPVATSQPQFSAAHLEPMRSGEFDRLMRDRVTPLAWSPMAGGRLATGEDTRPELIEVLDRLAAREGTDRASVALAFVLAHPSRPVAIIGTQNLDRIASAGAALSVDLDRNDVYDIVEASEGVPLP
jgi:predicted oxidoreductase